MKRIIHHNKNGVVQQIAMNECDKRKTFERRVFGVLDFREHLKALGKKLKKL